MNQQGAMEVLAGMLLCIGIIIVIALAIQILFLLNLHWTLAAVKERNRELSPGMVWLSLIPLFGMIWVIIMVPKIANSLRNEFEDRGWSTANEGFGRTVGMLWAWGGVANMVLSIAQNAAQFGQQQEVAMMLGLLGCPLGLAILVCWIMFWVQTYQYRKRLTDGPRGYREDSLEDDYDDRRPRRDEDDHGRRGDDDYRRDDERPGDDRPRRDRDEY
jgi:hypothetical protein